MVTGFLSVNSGFFTAERWEGTFLNVLFGFDRKKAAKFITDKAK